MTPPTPTVRRYLTLDEVVPGKWYERLRDGMACGLCEARAVFLVEQTYEFIRWGKSPGVSRKYVGRCERCAALETRAVMPGRDLGSESP